MMRSFYRLAFAISGLILGLLVVKNVGLAQDDRDLRPGIAYPEYAAPIIMYKLHGVVVDEDAPEYFRNGRLKGISNINITPGDVGREGGYEAVKTDQYGRFKIEFNAMGLGNANGFYMFADDNNPLRKPFPYKSSTVAVTMESVKFDERAGAFVPLNAKEGIIIPISKSPPVVARYGLRPPDMIVKYDLGGKVMKSDGRRGDLKPVAGATVNCEGQSAKSTSDGSWKIAAEGKAWNLPEYVECTVDYRNSAPTAMRCYNKYDNYGSIVGNDTAPVGAMRNGTEVWFVDKSCNGTVFSGAIVARYGVRPPPR